MFTRLMATFAFVFVAGMAAHAQDTRPDIPVPGQEGPPAQQDVPPPAPNERPPQQQTPRQPETAAPRADASPNRPDRCGAIAYTADGAFGGAYGLENCSDAEQLAVNECRRESTDKDDCSRGAVVLKDSWFHIQFCRSGGEWTTHVTTKQTLAEANASAADWANKSRYGSANCRLLPNGLFHSGGLHTKM